MLLEYQKFVDSEQLTLAKELKYYRRQPFGDVVVVASLLEKATNLGGVSRTAEIFGARKLVVHDQRVVKQRDFETLSVTAHHWLPIEAVSRKDLVAYLRARREDKYCIVGLEQTTSSQLLHHMDFAKKAAKC